MVVTVASRLTVAVTGLSPSLVSVSVTMVGSRSVVTVSNTEHVCAPSLVLLFRKVVFQLLAGFRTQKEYI